MKSRQFAALAPRAFLAAALLVACGVDERPLTFMLGSHTAGSTGDGGSGNAPPTETDGGTPGENGAGAQAGATDPAPGGDNAGGDAALPNGGRPNGGSAGMNSGGSAQGGSAGSSMNGGVSNGGSAGMASGGSGGAAFVSPCGDLNYNQVDDCQETRVKNSRFDTAATDWLAEPMVDQHWDATNATGGAGSGALLVANNNVALGVQSDTARASRQCVKAWSGQEFDVAARILLKSGAGTGYASLNLIYYAGDDCSGDLVTASTVGQVLTTDTWQVVGSRLQIPAATRSMLVRLMVTKPFSQSSLQALFDDVLISEHK